MYKKNSTLWRICPFGFGIWEQETRSLGKSGGQNKQNAVFVVQVSECPLLDQSLSLLFTFFYSHTVLLRYDRIYGERDYKYEEGVH